MHKCIEQLKKCGKGEVFIVIQNAIIMYFILLVFKDFFIRHKIIGNIWILNIIVVTHFHDKYKDWVLNFNIISHIARIKFTQY